MRRRKGQHDAVPTAVDFLETATQLLLDTSPRTLYTSAYMEISWGFARSATSVTRPRSAAALTVAFIPGQHRHAYINPSPATCTTFTVAFTLGTRFCWSRHHAPPFNTEA